VLAAKPIAYWRLDDIVVPTARDASAAGRDAAYESGVALYLPGVGSGAGRLPKPELTVSSFAGERINRAAHFAGGRLRARVPELGRRFTLELWLWNGLPPEARDVAGYFFSRGADGDTAARGEHLGIGGTHRTDATGRLILFNGNERGELLVGRTPLTLRTWHHVVFVREGTKATVYLDGKPDLEGELASTLPPGETTVFLGGRCDNFANLEGRLDEVALYTRALSGEEAASHFQASGFSAPATTPVNR